MASAQQLAKQHTGKKSTSAAPTIIFAPGGKEKHNQKDDHKSPA
jgi:hypothetical protein